MCELETQQRGKVVARTPRNRTRTVPCWQQQRSGLGRRLCAHSAALGRLSEQLQEVSGKPLVLLQREEKARFAVELAVEELFIGSSVELAASQPALAGVSL